MASSMGFLSRKLNSKAIAFLSLWFFKFLNILATSPKLATSINIQHGGIGGDVYLR